MKPTENFKISTYQMLANKFRRFKLSNCLPYDYIYKDLKFCNHFIIHLFYLRLS